MSVVFIDTGQAGNQLGYAVIDSLYQHLQGGPEEQLEYFFRASYDKSRTKKRILARAVCIDTEPKVINECVARTQTGRRGWYYDPKHVVYRHGGAGNNWAMGYDMCQGEFLDGSLSCIRREIERSDLAPCLCVLHSIAGGTGSGCGTRITEAIADEFPTCTRVNIAVTPYHFGEVVVQHYNAALSLSKVSNSSHAVFTFENEVHHQMCRDVRNIERPSLYNVNELIASTLVPALLPKYSAEVVLSQLNVDVSSDERFLSNTVKSPFLPKRKGMVSNSDLARIEQAIHNERPDTIHNDIQRLCADPHYRFLDVKTLPQTSSSAVDYTYDSWEGMATTLRVMCAAGKASERGLNPYMRLFKSADSCLEASRGYPRVALSSGAHNPLVESAPRSLQGEYLTQQTQAHISPSSSSSSAMQMQGGHCLGEGQLYADAAESTLLSSVGGGRGLEQADPRLRQGSNHEDFVTKLRDNVAKSSHQNNTNRPRGAASAQSSRIFRGQTVNRGLTSTADIPILKSLSSTLTFRGPDAPLGIAALRGDSSANANNSNISNSGSGSKRGADKRSPDSGSKRAGSLRSSPSSARAESSIDADLSRLDINASTSADDDDGASTSAHEMFFSPHWVDGYERSASIVSNSQLILPLLERSLSRSEAMFQVGAYVHQYTGCGLEEGDFQEAFANISRVVENYRNL